MAEPSHGKGYETGWGECLACGCRRPLSALMDGKCAWWKAVEVERTATGARGGWVDRCAELARAREGAKK